MKNEKISRRSFLKASAVASALGVMAAAPAAHAAGADEAAAQIEEENCLLKKPKYIFLFIGDGMGTAQIQSARFYKGTVDNNGAVTEADLSFTSFPRVGSVTTYDSTSRRPGRTTTRSAWSWPSPALSTLPAASSRRCRGTAPAPITMPWLPVPVTTW